MLVPNMSGKMAAALSSLFFSAKIVLYVLYVFCCQIPVMFIINYEGNPTLGPFATEF